MNKKIAILGSDRADVFEAIVDNLKFNTDITCISDNENSEILKSAKSMNINNEYLPMENISKYFSINKFDLIVLTDFQSKLPEETINSGNFINIHPSLLPAFNDENAIQKAFITGVKVSGVTVYKMNSDSQNINILAQYPVLIGLTTHIDEFEKDIYEIEKKLYPPVIKAILNDRVFDFQDLFQSPCHKNCGGGCGSCQN